MLKIFSCNKAIVKNNLKMYYFISIIWGVILFLQFPFQIFNKFLEIGNYNEWMSRVNFNTYGLSPVQALAGDDNPFYNIIMGGEMSGIFFMYIIPILFAIVFLRYIQTEKSTNFYHSLPVKREQILNSQLLSGFLLFFIPLAINLILAFLAYMPFGVAYGYIAYKLLVNIGLVYSAIFVMNFIIATAIGLLLGSSVLQGVFYYIFIFLPIYLVSMTLFFLQSFLYGYYINEKIFENVVRYTPITFGERLVKIIGASSNGGHNLTRSLIVALVYSLVMFFLAHFLYKKRDLEKNKQFIVFEKSKIFFIVILSTCSTLLFAMMLYGILGLSFTGLLVGGVLGAILGYWVTSMIVHKTIYVFKYYKGMLVYLTLVLVVIFGLKADILNFEGRVPDLSEVESIAFSDNANSNLVKEQARRELNGTFPDKEDYYKNRSLTRFVYKSDSGKQAIIDHHQAIVNGRGDLEKNRKRYDSVYIQYRLKNGKIITREYSITSDKIARTYDNLRKNQEYIYNNNMIFWDDCPQYTKAHIYNTIDGDGEDILIDNPEELNDLVQTIKRSISHDKDGWQKPISKYYDREYPSVVIEIFTDQEIKTYYEEYDSFGYKETVSIEEYEDGKPAYYSIKVNLDFNHPTFINWLKEKNYYKKIFFVKEDIEEIYLIKSGDEYFYHELIARYGSDLAKYLGEENSIKSKSEVERILNYIYEPSQYVSKYKLEMEEKYPEAAEIDQDKNGDISYATALIKTKKFPDYIPFRLGRFSNLDLDSDIKEKAINISEF